MNGPDVEKDRVLEAIAFNELRIRNLRAANSDREDFHECHVASIKAALEQAYHAGRNSAM